jgi:heme-degrading monooxygenase HmoA
VTPAAPAPAAGFRLLLRVAVDPERATEYEEAWREVAARVDAGGVCARQWLLRLDGEPGGYLIVSDWPDAAAFDRFRTSPAHDAHAADLKRYQRVVSVTTAAIAAEVESARDAAPRP